MAPIAPSSIIHTPSSVQVLPLPHSPSIQTSEHSNEHGSIIDVQHTSQLHTPTASTSWLARPACRLTTTEQSALLTPEQEHEQEQTHEIRQRVIHFTLSASVLVGSCIGTGWSADSVRQSSNNIPAYIPTTIPQDATFFELQRLLNLDSPPSNEETSSLRETFDIYLLVVFCMILLVSLSLTLLTSGRLALALHLRKRNNLELEKQGEETQFWSNMKRLFGDRSMQFKKLQLPTYTHAVKQSVLKTGRRPGDLSLEFHNVSAEEMELERIQKLGGAPPAYPYQC